MTKRGITIFLLFCAGIGFAQTSFSIKGRVLNGEQQLVNIGDVVLLHLEKEEVITYTIINDGNFELSDIPRGNYTIQISCLGFEILREELDLDKDVSLNFQLNEQTTALDEVEVTATKPMFSYNKGNLKIDATHPSLSTIPDPIDLLSKLPRIQLSPDRESISLIGKGTPLIYLENQRVSLTELRSMSVDEIESIEIINNPSAKYEAEGRAVLLITTKKNTADGLKLNLSETASFKRNFNNYLSASGSHKQKKVILKGSLARNDLQTWESNGFEFQIPERNILTNYLVLIPRNDRLQINGGSGFFLSN